ncbi:MAG TPA: hypothetical protein VG674_17300 [Amycolatopsis sp.]|nr:hypothetical protein [Amycolatopsis sp.]
MADTSHRADAGAMRAARGALEGAAAGVTEVASHVGVADFGRGHGAAFAAYSQGFEVLSEALRAYAGQLTEFGGAVEAAAGRYGSVDEEHADRMRRTGDR